MNKYKDYFYTTKKTIYSKYIWYIHSALDKDRKREVLQISSEPHDNKLDAQISAEEHIDEYYY